MARYFLRFWAPSNIVPINEKRLPFPQLWCQTLLFRWRRHSHAVLNDATSWRHLVVAPLDWLYLALQYLELYREPVWTKSFWNCLMWIRHLTWFKQVDNCRSIWTPSQITPSCPAGIYLLKVNHRNTGVRCEICSKLTIKTPERCQRHRSCVFIVNFEHILYHVIKFLLLTLNS